jgi:CRP-like cAMP-binding protein
LTVRIITIFGIGCLLSIGVLWSANVYGLSPFVAVLLSVLPWALACAAINVATRSSPVVELDLAKIVLQGKLLSRHFSGGDCVIRQGDEASHFYIITSGRARVLKDDEYGSRIEVAELGVGQFFGEVGLLTGSVRTATVEAVDDLDVLVMDKRIFADLVGQAGAASEYIRGVAHQRMMDTK